MNRDRNKLNIINMILKVKQGNQKILLMYHLKMKQCSQQAVQIPKGLKKSKIPKNAFAGCRKKPKIKVVK